LLKRFINAQSVEEDNSLDKKIRNLEDIATRPLGQKIFGSMV
jgi:chorismate-pyruvate lyase